MNVRSGRPGELPAREAREDVGGDRLELVALVRGVADGVHDEVAAAGRARSAASCSAHCSGVPMIAVLAGERLEVLRVAPAELLDPARSATLESRPTVMKARCADANAVERPAGGRGGRADLVEALARSARAARRRTSSRRPGGRRAPARRRSGRRSRWAARAAARAWDRCDTPSKRVKRPLKLAGVSRQSVRTTSMPSVTRAPRSLVRHAARPRTPSGSRRPRRRRRSAGRPTARRASR